MTHRIDRCFQQAAQAGRKVLVPFMTAGDPHPDWTVPLMHALVRRGADLLELGVPFSDPMADGPVIQAASERAIARGMNLQKVLDCVREFRQDDEQTPVVLMGYLNPVERFGTARFAEAAASAGVDGLLLVDCPPEELPDLQSAMSDNGLYSIRLVAPTTTPARLASVVASAQGFVYYVSFKGITGAGQLDTGALAEPLAAIRAQSSLPVAVGFGIKDAESARAVARYADAVVIGSALVQVLAQESESENAQRAAGSFVASIRQALDNA